MWVVTPRRLTEFSTKYTQAKLPLLYWYEKTKKASWRNFSEIRQDFPSTDYVGRNRFVFNVKGNDFRLIAIIIFASQKVYIRFIGTHLDYDKVDVRNI
ncbi:MAG: type II toxin-antitoxin system HigB family toxin [Bacteroidota bacterium]